MGQGIELVNAGRSLALCSGVRDRGGNGVGQCLHFSGAVDRAHCFAVDHGAQQAFCGAGDAGHANGGVVGGGRGGAGVARCAVSGTEDGVVAVDEGLQFRRGVHVSAGDGAAVEGAVDGGQIAGVHTGHTGRCVLRHAGVAVGGAVVLRGGLDGVDRLDVGRQVVHHALHFACGVCACAIGAVAVEQVVQRWQVGRGDAGHAREGVDVFGRRCGTGVVGLGSAADDAQGALFGSGVGAGGCCGGFGDGRWIGFVGGCGCVVCGSGRLSGRSCFGCGIGGCRFCCGLFDAQCGQLGAGWWCAQACDGVVHGCLCGVRCGGGCVGCHRRVVCGNGQGIHLTVGGGFTRSGGRVGCRGGAIGGGGCGVGGGHAGGFAFACGNGGVLCGSGGSCGFCGFGSGLGGGSLGGGLFDFHSG